MPEEIEFRTKPQIALSQIVRALDNGIRVSAWTFDEFYGRDLAFLDGVEARRQAWVGEIPCNFHGWLQQPAVLRTGPQTTRKCGRRKHYPCVARRRPSCVVRNLLKHSPVFRKQSWQRYRIKDTDHGPEVWEVKWAVFWRKNAAGLPTRRHCLIVARNVLTSEVKYLLANRVPGDHVNRITVEQVRSAMDAWLDSADLPPRCQRQRFEKQQRKQQYYERRNMQARVSHTKRDAADSTSWVSMPTGSNRASTARTAHDLRHFQSTIYGQLQHQSGAVQLISLSDASSASRSPPLAENNFSS